MVICSGAHALGCHSQSEVGGRNVPFTLRVSSSVVMAPTHGMENELHKLPLLHPQQGLQPKFPKSQQHSLPSGLCHFPEAPNQLFTLIEAWIQPGACGAQSSITAESCLQVRMGFGSSEGHAPEFCNSAFACPKTPSSSKPSFAARCQICTSLNRAPSLPCTGIGEMGLRYACNFHTLLTGCP